MDETFQTLILRLSTCNTLQRKSWQQLIAEHERLRLYEKAFIRKLTLNLQPELKISIVDLQVDNVHTGKFLLCRVIVKWIKLNALITVVEDPKGNVERLSLDNIFLELVTVGTQLVIKNPTYKIAADGNTIIRSDNPEDIIVIDHVNKLFNDLEWSTDLIEDDTKERSSDDYRLCGNEYFNLNDY